MKDSPTKLTNFKFNDNPTSLNNSKRKIVWLFPQGNNKVEENYKFLISIFPEEKIVKIKNISDFLLFIDFEKKEAKSEIYLITSVNLAKELDSKIEEKNLIKYLFIYDYNDEKLTDLIKMSSKLISNTQNFSKLSQELILRLEEGNKAYRYRLNYDLLAQNDLNLVENSINNIFIDNLNVIFDMSKFSLKESQSDFLKFCHENLEEYSGIKEHLKEIENDVRSDNFENKILWWFSRESFFNKMININMQKSDFHSLFRLRYAIGLLNRQLKKMSSQNDVPEQLFRACKVPKEDMKTIVEKKTTEMDTFFMLKGVTTLSSDYETVEDSSNNFNNPNFYSVLLTFNLNNCDHSKVFYINDMSYNPHQDEYILNNGTFVKIESIEKSNSESFEYNIVCSLDDNNNTRKYLEQVQQEKINLLKEIRDSSYKKDIFYYVEFFEKMGKYDYCLEILSKYDCKDDLDTYNAFFARLYEKKGEFDTALKYKFNNLKLNETIPFNVVNPASTYKDFAKTFFDNEDYENAIDYCSKALEIEKVVFGEESINVANTSDSLSTFYLNNKDYQNSLKYALIAMKIYEVNSEINSVDIQKRVSFLYKKVGDNKNYSKSKLFMENNNSSIKHKVTK